MAELIKNTEKSLVKFCAGIFGAILSLFGVITGSCGSMPCDYGVEPPPRLTIDGSVKSGTAAVEGIRVQVSSMDSSQVFDSNLSTSQGYFGLYTEEKPDSILVTATDIDGPDNGLYLPAQTFRATDPDLEEEAFTIDFNLLPDEQ